MTQGQAHQGNERIGIVYWAWARVGSLSHVYCRDITDFQSRNCNGTYILRLWSWGPREQDTIFRYLKETKWDHVLKWNSGMKSMWPTYREQFILVCPESSIAQPTLVLTQWDSQLPDMQSFQLGVLLCFVWSGISLCSLGNCKLSILPLCCPRVPGILDTCLASLFCVYMCYCCPLFLCL